MEKTKGRIIKNPMYYILHMLLWGFNIVLLNFGIKFGIFSAYYDAFGLGLVIFGFAAALIVFLSIFWLQYIFKRTIVTAVSAFFLTVIFDIAAILILYAAMARFNVFSSEKWIECPAQRMNMYFDLVDRYDISGLSENELTELLGQPDRIHTDEYKVYVYEDGYDNEAYFYLGDGFVVNYGYSE